MAQLTEEEGLELITGQSSGFHESFDVSMQIIDKGWQEKVVMGEDGLQGEVFYVAADGLAYKAKADAAGTSNVIGFLIADKLEGNDGYFRTWGVLTTAGWGLTTGSKYYLSPSVAGAITLVQPSNPDSIVDLGYARSTTKFGIRPRVYLSVMSHPTLSNLPSSVSGHTIDSDIDYDGNDIDNANDIECVSWTAVGSEITCKSDLHLNATTKLVLNADVGASTYIEAEADDDFNIWRDGVHKVSIRIADIDFFSATTEWNNAGDVAFKLTNSTEGKTWQILNQAAGTELALSRTGNGGGDIRILAGASFVDSSMGIGMAPDGTYSLKLNKALFVNSGASVFNSGALEAVATFTSTDNRAFISVSDNDTTAFLSAMNATVGIGFGGVPTTEELQITAAITSITNTLNMGTNNITGVGNVEQVSMSAVGAEITCEDDFVINLDDLYFTGESSGLIFGVMYIPGVDIVVATGDANPHEVEDATNDGWSAGELNEVTFPTAGTEHYLTVPVAGKYLVTWAYSGHTDGGGGTEVHGGIAIDGAFLRDCGEGHSSVINLNTTVEIGSSCIIDCPNGTEEISVWVEISNSQDFHIEHGTMVITLVGGT